jgi:hypothetical protein
MDLRLDKESPTVDASLGSVGIVDVAPTLFRARKTMCILRADFARGVTTCTKG